MQPTMRSDDSNADREAELPTLHDHPAEDERRAERGSEQAPCHHAAGPRAHQQLDAAQLGPRAQDAGRQHQKEQRRMQRHLGRRSDAIKVPDPEHISEHHQLPEQRDQHDQHEKKPAHALRLRVGSPAQPTRTKQMAVVIAILPRRGVPTAPGPS